MDNLTSIHVHSVRPVFNVRHLSNSVVFVSCEPLWGFRKFLRCVGARVITNQKGQRVEAEMGRLQAGSQK